MTFICSCRNNNGQPLSQMSVHPICICGFHLLILSDFRLFPWILNFFNFQVLIRVSRLIIGTRFSNLYTAVDSIWFVK
jgi:hypothetical protein